MPEIYYQTRFYSDDEIKMQFINDMRRKDLRAYERDCVATLLNKENLTVKRECHRSVKIKCDKEVTVHYEAHKKVEETTGYTITRRVDVMNLVDYKVTENTKNVTYESSYDYTKKFYDVSEWEHECVEKNFCIDFSNQGPRGYSKTMPDAYKGVKPWTGLPYDVERSLGTPSGCSCEISSCRNDLYDLAKGKGYTLDSVKFKSATVTNVVVERVEYDIVYCLQFVYRGLTYSYKVDSYGVSGDIHNLPRSKDFEERIAKGIEEGKKIKNKAKRVTIPTIIIAVVGILFTIVGAFMVAFGELFGMVIASLVFNGGYFIWVGSKLFAEVDEKINKLKKQLEYGEYVDNVTMPTINMKSLIIGSIALTIFNLFCCLIPFYPNFL